MFKQLLLLGTALASAHASNQFPMKIDGTASMGSSAPVAIRRTTLAPTAPAEDPTTVDFNVATKHISLISSILNQAESANNSLRKQRDDSESKVVALTAQTSELEKQIEYMRSTIDEHNNTISHLQAQLEKSAQGSAQAKELETALEEAQRKSASIEESFESSIVEINRLNELAKNHQAEYQSALRENDSIIQQLRSSLAVAERQAAGSAEAEAQATQARAALEKLQSAFDSSQAASSRQTEELQSKIRKLGESYQTLNTDLNAHLDTRHSEQTKALAERDAMFAEFNKVAGVINAKLQADNEEQKKSHEFAIQGIQADFDGISRTKTQLQEEVATLNAQIAAGATKHNELLDQLNKQLDEKSSMIADMMASLHRANVEAKIHQEQLSASVSKDDHLAAISALQAEHDATKAAHENLTRTHGEVLADRDKATAEANAASTRVTELEAQMLSSQTAIGEKDDQISTLTEQLQAASAAKTAADAERARLEQALVNLNSTLAGNEAAQAALNTQLAQMKADAEERRKADEANAAAIQQRAEQRDKERKERGVVTAVELRAKQAAQADALAAQVAKTRINQILRKNILDALIQAGVTPVKLTEAEIAELQKAPKLQDQTIISSIAQKDATNVASLKQKASELGFDNVNGMEISGLTGAVISKLSKQAKVS